MKNLLRITLMSLLIALPALAQNMQKTSINLPTAAEENTEMYWYQVSGDDILGGVGPAWYDYPIRVFVKLPQERCQQLKNMTIEEIGIGLGAEIGKDYKLIITSDPASENVLLTQEFTPEQNDTLAWKNIQLDTPLKIDGESDLYIGAQCIPEESNYYFLLFGVDMEYADFRDDRNAVYVWNTVNNQWEKIHDYPYNPCIRVGISGEELPHNDLAVFSCSAPQYIMTNEEFTATVTVKNQGMEPVTNMNVSYKFGTIEKTLTLTDIDLAPQQLYEFSIEGLQTAETGYQPISITVEENGKTDFTTEDNTKSFNLFIADKGYDRTVLLDEIVYDTSTDLSAFHQEIENTLKERGLADKVAWVQHHANDEYSLNGDKTSFFFDRNYNEFYPAFMVDHRNFSDSGATIPNGDNSMPSPTPFFQYSDGNVFDYIEESLAIPTFINCYFEKTGEETTGEETTYTFKLHIEQMAEGTIPNLRYITLLTEDKDENWKNVPAEFYGGYADSWGTDLTLTEPYVSEEITVTIPKGQESRYKLIGYVNDLSSDKNAMIVHNATVYPLTGYSSAELIRTPLKAFADNDRIIVSAEAENVSVFNLYGVCIFNGTPAALAGTTFESGIYVVKATADGETLTAKVCIR